MESVPGKRVQHTITWRQQPNELPHYTCSVLVAVNDGDPIQPRVETAAYVAGANQVYGPEGRGFYEHETGKKIRNVYAWAYPPGAPIFDEDTHSDLAAKNPTYED